MILHISSVVLLMSLAWPSASGEIYYRQYRILPNRLYDPYQRQQTVYYNPYVHNNYRYTTPAAVRYTQPVRSYAYAAAPQPQRDYQPQRNYYNDDKVYVTDMYGRTTVHSESNYKNYISKYSVAMPDTTVCSANTCGHNAQCSMIGGRPVCSCFRGYMGDPITQCTKAECLESSECRGHLTCKNERCVDPCLDVCGSNANCETRNHIPVCTCPAGFTGNPFSHCRRFDPEELCHPSPCGPNTQCEVVNGVPTCKCLSGYHGSPIAGCRHECETSSECGGNLACIEFKCQDPCPSQCGINAECAGVNNNAAVCKCPRGYFGNPYSSCQAECTTHSDCPRSKPACFYNSCKNPCDGVCGIGANCELRDITPICSCPKDMTGDPFVRCRPFEKRDLCEPNPCGANAHCEPGYDKYNKERPVCTCLPGYQGDPLRGCVRGECTEDSHCADHLACIDYKCQNPCRGQCGSNADCMPKRHIAVCTCLPGHNGDALSNCYKVAEASFSARYYRHTLGQTDFHPSNTTTSEINKIDEPKKSEINAKETEKVEVAVNEKATETKQPKEEIKTPVVNDKKVDEVKAQVIQVTDEKKH